MITQPGSVVTTHRVDAIDCAQWSAECDVRRSLPAEVADRAVAEMRRLQVFRYNGNADFSLLALFWRLGGVFRVRDL